MNANIDTNELPVMQIDEPCVTVVKNKWYCYILRSTNPFYNNHTYNGSTNNLKRRIRQHNGELVGGAKATKNKGPWEYYAILTGFNDNHEALACEWKIKYPTNKKRPMQFCGQYGRIKSLNLILNQEKWTSNYSVQKDNTYVLYLSNDMMNIINKKFVNKIQVVDINKINCLLTIS
jgi:predicted GIY-YIG superfamily endonuclease